MSRDYAPPTTPAALAGPRVPTGGRYVFDFTKSTNPYSMGLTRNGNWSAYIRNGAVCTPLSRTLDPVPNRTELVPTQLPPTVFADRKTAHFGRTYFYAVDIFLPADTQPDTDSGESLVQWHDIPDASEASKNPAVALMLYKENYVLAIRGDSKAHTPPSGKGRYTRESSIRLGTFLGDRGHWVRWTFRIKWAFNSTGTLTVWRNNTVVYNETGRPNAFNDRKGPMFKFGVYKWAWPHATKVEHRNPCFRQMVIQGPTG